MLFHYILPCIGKWVLLHIVWPFISRSTPCKVNFSCKSMRSKKLYCLPALCIFASRYMDKSSKLSHHSNNKLFAIYRNHGVRTTFFCPVVRRNSFSSFFPKYIVCWISSVLGISVTSRRQIKIWSSSCSHHVTSESPE